MMGTLGQIKAYEKYKPKEDVCVWQRLENGNYDTECGRMYSRFGYQAIKDEYKNKCGCQKPIKVVDNE